MNPFERMLFFKNEYDWKGERDRYLKELIEYVF